MKTDISNNIKFVGVNDHNIDLFEGQFIVPNGMSYNSYIILDEKIAVLDSVDKNFGSEWISNIKSQLNGKNPDYLVVHHMEMDHSANIKLFTEAFPEAKIVASKLAFVIMNNLFDADFSDKQIVVTEGSTLSLGKHCLNFIAAPNVHWPEVVMSYESTEKILFSADGFGKFGALDKESGTSPEEWTCEARRYYFGIVGKFGEPVQAVLKKLPNIQIEKICPLHGPVLTENLSYYINLYDIWSSYKPESQGIFIAYSSVYGNTKKAVEEFAEILKAKGCTKVKIADLAREDMAECVEDAFRYDKLVLATTTYTNDIFPVMKEFIHHLVDRNYQNRTIGLIGNGSWNPVATKVMATMFEKSKNINLVEPSVTIKTALNKEARENLEKLAEHLI
ncbi:MAG: FprA family A-type flavoprotein [Treponema sp.]|nr:FprA family A-type flavoprotein [Treponema sp.]MBR4012306.1 FprA family A-type flavoprotein [Spirochaetaceae bacterium]